MITYQVPEELPRKFRRGDRVEVCDRDLSPMSLQRVVYAGTKIVRTSCGRRWRASDGWWIGSNGTWPFPSIRLAGKA